MTGYVHHSKRPEAARPPAAPETSPPADPRVPARMSQEIAQLRAALRREHETAAQAKESRAKALRLADENAKQNRSLQTQIDKLGPENHALRAELTDAREANTALLADVADLSRQVTERDARIAELEAQAVGDIEAIITFRGKDMTTSRANAYTINRALGAVANVITLQMNGMAQNQAYAEHTAAEADQGHRPTGTHLKAVSA